MDNTEDIIDSRDVIALIDELEAGGDDLDEDEREELRVLSELADDGTTNVTDWPYGEALIRDSYFEEYARQLAEDIGAVDPAAAWPLNHVDWQAAADELKADYTELDFDGVTYWART